MTSAMSVDYQQNPYEQLNDFSKVTMSTVDYLSTLSTHLNSHHSQYIYPFENHQQQFIIQNTQQQQQQQQQTTTHSSHILVNDFHQDEHCQVCGDLASGWHCGAITCEACKKFFLRSISTGDPKKKYKCQKDYSCSITKRSRTQCQYCRFQKCISLGMKPHESIGPKTEDLYKKLPCLVCGASASGIHFGAVTCEACKGFFRRSIKENAPEKYHCSENNNCQINSTSKITCRACRFRKCIQAGMSMDASRIGRQSNLFKESIRQLQNGSTTMATVTDSTRITTMAKKRQIKAKSGKMFASNNEIDVELTMFTKEFIERVHNAYLMHLKNLPQCIPHETIWHTMASQMIVYAEAVMNFCQKTIPGFDYMREKYDIISSSIHSVIMITLFSQTISNKFSSNYWNAESTLSIRLMTHIPQLTQTQNTFHSFYSKVSNLQLDQKELSLLLLMIITRTNLHTINEENQLWSKCQYECVQAFSEYSQARRSNRSNEFPIEVYEIAFLVSQFRTLNREISKCLMNVPWPYIQNLPSFFYRIYLPSIANMSTIVNSNYNQLSLSPIQSTINNTNHYENEPSWYVPDLTTTRQSYSSLSSNSARYDCQTNDDITVSIRW